jgi:malonyl-CoA/methylmalonyl-CoA synthetase
MIMRAPFLSAIQETFRQHRARDAAVFGGRIDAYADLAEDAASGAALLQQWHGISKGDRVVLCTSNKRLFLDSLLATLFAGAVCLPLNPRFTREELRYFLADSDARLAIADKDSKPVLESLRPELPKLSVMLDAEIQDLVSKPYTPPPNLTADDPCLMLYSSGTTGWPKGVVHTHGNVASALLALQQCWRVTPDDVVLNVLPLFHIHGLCFATLLTLLSGGCLIFDEFEPQKTMERVRDCTIFMAVPTIYYRFLEQLNFREVAKTWTKTRLFTCGSAPIRSEVLPELEAILGKPVINRYGMTEAFVITSLPLDGPWPNGSVGKPLDGIEVRISEESPGVR